MPIRDHIRYFFLPPLTWRLLARALLVAIAAYLFFGYLCIPMHIEGISMEPAYRDGSFNFCWRLRYLFSAPKRHDVVAVRFAGNRVMLLKRIVAMEGEEVEFQSGKLYINGEEMEEPYIGLPSDWNLPPRLVEKGCVYVIGDNRSMPIENHLFGNASTKRIIGGPLW